MTVFRAATLRTFFFTFHAGAKELTQSAFLKLSLLTAISLLHEAKES